MDFLVLVGWHFLSAKPSSFKYPAGLSLTLFKNFSIVLISDSNIVFFQRTKSFLDKFYKRTSFIIEECVIWRWCQRYLLKIFFRLCVQVRRLLNKVPCHSETEKLLLK